MIYFLIKRKLDSISSNKYSIYFIYGTLLLSGRCTHKIEIRIFLYDKDIDI